MIPTIFQQWEYRSVGLYILMLRTRPSQANNFVCQFDIMTVLRLLAWLGLYGATLECINQLTYTPTVEIIGLHSILLPIT